MANFKDYMKNKKPEPSAKEIVNNASPSQKAQAQNIYSQYKGKSEGELMSEIEERIRTQKKNGGFNEQEIMQFVRQVSPMLGNDERKKLMAIISKMK